ncbi:MAG: hypothetical protein A4E31_00188 [Methanomassiliicoccales archaeon PtaU1.Bin030]|nr:MAG: hypothetical protein A4E31_00188 [Methanomassiliicoccales archaeon PtaU1.Bin030]
MAPRDGKVLDLLIYRQGINMGEQRHIVARPEPRYHHIIDVDALLHARGTLRCRPDVVGGEGIRIVPALGRDSTGDELEAHPGCFAGDGHRLLQPFLGSSLLVGVGPQDVLRKHAVTGSIVDDVEEIIPNICPAVRLPGIRATRIRVEPEVHGDRVVVASPYKLPPHDGIHVGIVTENQLCRVHGGL